MRAGGRAPSAGPSSRTSSRPAYAGQLFAVNPNTREISGVASFPDVASLPETPDLALLAVPPAEVVDTAEACGRRGVRGLVVFAAAVDEPTSAGLLAVCRRYGMRLIGPNCFGIAVPSIGLDATFAAANPLAGTAGLVMQSGGLGFAMVDHLTRLGIGISSFASVGNKLDVSSNDMLMWWERDGQTRVAVLYIESFGNPRKFARTARRVGGRIPVLTVHAGRSEAGQRAAASHTSSASTPLVTREALFEQAGIIVTASFGELMEATALLATQPPPVGRTVAIVSNVGGAGVLAADACTELGLSVHHPRGETSQRLHALIPDGGSVTGPVDTAATVSADDFRQVLEALAADEDVHAIIALVLRTGATGDLVSAIADAAIGVPFAAVVLDQPEAVRVIDAKDGKVPAYAYPEAAARALARAARYAEWRAAPHAAVPAFADVDAERGRDLVRAFLVTEPDGGWLPKSDVTALLGLYGISVASAETISSGDAVIISVKDDKMFGPLVVFGLSGGGNGALADHAARLAPLTSADADMLIHSIRSAPLLNSYLGAPGAEPSPASAALRDTLLRVSRLTEDLPEITGLDLDPVIAGPDGAVAAGARIRVAPQVPEDPFLRRLRLPAARQAGTRANKECMSAGTAKDSSLAPPGPASDQEPGRARTAIAAVGNIAGGSGGGSVRPWVSSAIPGLCPTTSAVRHCGENSRTSMSRPSTDASYTRGSYRTCGAAPGTAASRPPAASSQVCLARSAVEQTTASGTYPASPSQRPATGASRRPRLASGRSWSAMSGQSDFACRSSTSRRPLPPGRPSRDHRHRPLARPDEAHRERPEQPVAGLERGTDDDRVGPRLPRDPFNLVERVTAGGDEGHRDAELGRHFARAAGELLGDLAVRLGLGRQHARAGRSGQDVGPGGLDVDGHHPRALPAGQPRGVPGSARGGDGLIDTYQDHGRTISA